MTYRDALINPIDTNLDLSNKSIIILTLVSCMCNNISYIKFSRDGEDIKINHYNDHCSLSLSNLQIKVGDTSEMMKWAILDNDFKELSRIVNTGTSQITDVKSRKRVAA